MTLVAGTRLGPYEILSALGAGGMGEVYRARDTKLGREVAIKVLPDLVANDPERLARFHREAQVLASLNHPNIAHIYGVEDSSGTHALVMELVEGPTLADRIARSPIPLAEALPIAKQIAEALEAAHEQGIIHRDLKPANIKVRDDGTVKVLDFGLAKLVDPVGSSPANANVTASPTITTPAMMTGIGVILGTAAYMSPEQAKGRPADKRSDVWAFGCVLYEMLTGQRTFAGDDVAETLANILTKEPDLSRIPAPARSLVTLCLKKNRAERLKDLGDAMLLVGAMPTTTVGKTTHRWRSVAAAATALVAGVTIGAVVASRGRQAESASQPLVRLNVDLGADVSLGANGVELALSPDGTRLVYASNARLFMRRLDQNSAVELRGTERGYSPFFSPDGQSVAFFADRKLKTVALDTSIVRTVCDTGTLPRTGSWGNDGRIVADLGLDGVISRVPASGGKPEAVTTLDKQRGDAGHRAPLLLPGSQTLIFVALRDSSAGPSELRAISLSDRHVTILHNGTAPRFLPGPGGKGFLLFMEDNTVFAELFDPKTLAVIGKATAMFDQVALAVAGLAQLDVSTTGRVVYQEGVGAYQDLVIQLLTPSGATPLLMKPGRYSRVQVAPDGKRLAFQFRQGSASQDVWILDLRTSATTRLTFNDGEAPQWAPDGRSIANRNPIGLYRAASDGSGAPIELAKGENMYLMTFTPDGRQLLFQQSSGGRSDVGSIPYPADGEAVSRSTPTAVITGPFDERQPALSRDGKWIAYSSDETGEFHVYVRPFPNVGSAKWQVSRDGGGLYPTWSAVESKLFFRNSDNQILSADYEIRGGSFFVEQPRLWSDVKLADLGVAGARNFDLTPDGHHVAAIMQATSAARHTVVFLDHFLDELQRRVH